MRRRSPSIVCIARLASLLIPLCVHIARRLVAQWFQRSPHNAQQSILHNIIQRLPFLDMAADVRNLFDDRSTNCSFGVGDLVQRQVVQQTVGHRQQDGDLFDGQYGLVLRLFEDLAHTLAPVQRGTRLLVEPGAEA